MKAVNIMSIRRMMLTVGEEIFRENTPSCATTNKQMSHGVTWFQTRGLHAEMPTNTCLYHGTTLMHRHICLPNKQILFMTFKISPTIQLNIFLDVRNLITEVKHVKSSPHFSFPSTAGLINRHQNFQQHASFQHG
jgi:hypothetical protein